MFFCGGINSFVRVKLRDIFWGELRLKTKEIGKFFLDTLSNRMSNKMWSSAVFIVIINFLSVMAKDVSLKQMLEDLKLETTNIQKHHLGQHLFPTYDGNKLSVNFQCMDLYNALLSNGTAPVWPPPKTMPERLRKAYTLDGSSSVFPRYYSEKQNGGEGYDWPESLIEKQGAEKNTCGNYKLPQCKVVVDKYSQYIKDKTGMFAFFVLHLSLLFIFFDFWCHRHGIWLSDPLGRIYAGGSRQGEKDYHR